MNTPISVYPGISRYISDPFFCSRAPRRRRGARSRRHAGKADEPRASAFPALHLLRLEPPASQRTDSRGDHQGCVSRYQHGGASRYIPVYPGSFFLFAGTVSIGVGPRRRPAANEWRIWKVERRPAGAAGGAGKSAVDAAAGPRPEGFGVEEGAGGGVPLRYERDRRDPAALPARHGHASAPARCPGDGPRDSSPVRWPRAARARPGRGGPGGARRSWRSWPSRSAGRHGRRATLEVVGPRSQGAIQMDPGLSLSLGRRRRGCNNPRAFARNRRETGSLGTAPSATQSRRCSNSGIVQGQPWVFRGFQAISAGAERGAEKGRRGWGEVAAGVLVIVSRAGFRGPGWALPGHLPSCERRTSNWAAGTVQFCRPIPARGWAPVRIGIPVVPENPA